MRWLGFVAAAALLIPGFCLAARQSHKAHNARKSTAHPRRRYYRRYHHYRHYYIRPHISPERVRQIQQALVAAGYLHEKPDGIWGPATSDAMRHYQEANGFAPTGLPEAKPLMKLGLGPHPLPQGLEHSPSTEAENHGEADASAAPSSSPAKKPSTSNP